MEMLLMLVEVPETNMEFLDPEVVALVGTVLLAEMGEIRAVAQPAETVRPRLAEAEAEAEVAHMKRTYTLPELGSITAGLAGAVLGCLALAVMGPVAAEETRAAAVVALAALEGPMVAVPLAMLDPEVHTAVEPEGMGTTRIHRLPALGPAAASALFVSSGALAVAIRRTPQTSN